MKKLLSLLLAAVMVLSLAACGAKSDTSTTTAAGAAAAATEKTEAAGKAKTYHVLSGSAEGNPVYDVFDTIVKDYQAEVNPDFNVEYEVITSTSDL